MAEPVTTWPHDSVDLYKGEIITFKGKLDAVRWNPPHRGASVCLSFADWSLVSIDVCDVCTAQGIRIPLSSYVTVKARVVDEDGTLEAIAIWTQGGVPIPLARDTALGLDNTRENS